MCIGAYGSIAVVGTRQIYEPVTKHVAVISCFLQVQRLLWHALGTATVSLHSFADEGITSTITRISHPSGRSSSSSRATSTTRSTTSGSRSSSSLMPKGASYSFKLSTNHGIHLARDAAFALLQLAVEDVPGPLKADLAAARQQRLLLSSQAAREGEALGDEMPGVPAVTPPAEGTSAALQAGATAATITASSGSSSSGSSSSTGGSAASVTTSPEVVTSWDDYKAAGYLSWPFWADKAGGKSIRTDISGRSSSNSSGGGSSSSRGSSSNTLGQTTLDALSSAGARLRLLTASVSASVAAILRLGVSSTKDAQDVLGPACEHVAVLATHLLLLMTQQLQQAPAPVRATFLHSPAGSYLLRVLQLMALGKMSLPMFELALADVLVRGGWQAAAAAGEQQQQQQQDGTASWVVHQPSTRELVEQLLLPALLLQPASLEPGSTEVPGGSSSTAAGRLDARSNSSSRSSSSSHNMQGYPALGIDEAAASSSNHHVVLHLGQGECAGMFSGAYRRMVL
jgi:hypothetical protein